MVKRKATINGFDVTAVGCPKGGRCRFVQHGSGMMVFNCAYCVDIKNTGKHGPLVYCSYHELFGIQNNVVDA